ncbi:beta-L-arabinofuranosidase domain-containing protein [Neobacillus sp. CF12]|uniref:glycoside hydrolase family 127 protein n=1 Tax=Neobacillus sp. CF12 TaxID=3055864 RepID=UPI0025A0049C|nr:beta-L-arabinofuranosidase domain-containing protein [Neobacillus sp. CF12]MDM5327832.1 glycoside hydrolase family 127 protein [Neobacillus sp. CF12]
MHVKGKNENRPLPLQKVEIRDQFWKPKININREHTIPFQYKQCLETGRVDALKLKEDGPVPHPFWDSDIAKWIEAGSYSLAKHYDSKLDQLIDDVIDLLGSAQQPDGYLNSYITLVCPQRRWKDLRDSHELYCAGHLIEAGVAHFNATKKRSLLDIVCKYADYIDTVFGPEPGKLKGYCGHEEIELALIKLYRVNENEKYLKLSQYFIDERGKEPHYFDEEQKHIKGYFDDLFRTFSNLKEYNQSHKPVREQDKVVGHSVRAMYLYSAMADLALELDDHQLKTACEKLWQNLNGRNMYITGGIGSEEKHEGFTFDYDLPNETSYAETCAAIGLVFWNHRMLQLDCNGRYADLMERALYNGVLSGISLDGRKYFYHNPLASLGDVHRKEWFGVSCCPPNISRLLSSLGEYIYSHDSNTINVHLYIEGSGTFNLHNNQKLILHQKSNYPWEENIDLTVELDQQTEFKLKLRVPGWCRDAKLSINGEPFNIQTQLEKGYVVIDRKWSDHDKISLNLPMPVERMYSHPAVRQNVNHVSIQRGPIVYCIEGTDNVNNLHDIILPSNTVLHAQYDEQLLGGIVKITGKAVLLESESWGDTLYQSSAPEEKMIELVAVPYYAWDNREPGPMRVWIPEK